MDLPAGWGDPAPFPSDGVIAHSDAALHHILEDARLHKRPLPPVGLVGGDLCRTLGGGTTDRAGTLRRLEEGEGLRFTVDVGEVLMDGSLRLFAAHLVARSRAWRRAFVAMNAQYFTPTLKAGPMRLARRAWDLGPRSHPCDGILDVYEAELTLNQAMAVRARVVNGAHLPHPAIRSRRTAAIAVGWDQPRTVWIDGERVGTARNLSLRLRAGSLAIWT